MNLDEKQELLRELCRIQATGTSPINIGIGWTDKTGLVHDDIIVIYECPPKVINELITKRYMLSLERSGVHVIMKDKDE